MLCTVRIYDTVCVVCRHIEYIRHDLFLTDPKTEIVLKYESGGRRQTNDDDD